MSASGPPGRDARVSSLPRRTVPLGGTGCSSCTGPGRGRGAGKVREGSSGPCVRGILGFSPKAPKALGRLQRAGHPRGTDPSQRGTSVTQGPCDWETQGGGAGFSRSGSRPGAAGCLQPHSGGSVPHPQPGAWGRGGWRGGGVARGTQRDHPVHPEPEVASRGNH